MRTYHIVSSASASTAVLRALLFRWRRGTRRLARRRRRSRPLLLVPLIELLLLLLFVLRVTLLHRRCRANQGMRLWRSLPHLLLLRRPEVAVRRLGIAILLRLHVSVLRLLHSPVFRLLHAAILGLRSSLLLVSSRLRLRHLPDLIVAAIGLAKGSEAILRRHRPAAEISRGGLRRTDRTNQYLLV